MSRRTIAVFASIFVGLAGVILLARMGGPEQPSYPESFANGAAEAAYRFHWAMTASGPELAADRLPAELIEYDLYALARAGKPEAVRDQIDERLSGNSASDSTMRTYLEAFRAGLEDDRVAVRRGIFQLRSADAPLWMTISLALSIEDGPTFLSLMRPVPAGRGEAEVSWWLERDPRMDFLRGDPRFEALLARLRKEAARPPRRSVAASPGT